MPSVITSSIYCTEIIFPKVFVSLVMVRESLVAKGSHKKEKLLWNRLVLARFEKQKEFRGKTAFKFKGKPFKVIGRWQFLVADANVSVRLCHRQTPLCAAADRIFLQLRLQ